MLNPKDFVEFLKKCGVNFFTGVPDSLIKDLIAYIDETVPKQSHVTAANEGNAIGIAAGYHLSTGGVAAVYLQNSGLGNAVNPLVSLVDKEVYSIPIILIIGWRGEPGINDEPQHMKQGKITVDLLKLLGIPYVIIGGETEDFEDNIKNIIDKSRIERCPCAILVRKGVFEKYNSFAKAKSQYLLTREKAIEIIVENIESEAIIVSTTGKISRELYEVRKRRNENSDKDFLTVGSMGHASQIALGIAMQKEEKRVYCLDGDGATIMHMGGLATIGWVAPKNFRHILLNNLAHESVGGQKSAALITNLSAVAKDCGFVNISSVDNEVSLVETMSQLKKKDGPTFLEVMVNLESREDLSRPKETPEENKRGFMDFIS